MTSSALRRKLAGTIESVSSLREEHEVALYALFERHYEHVSEDRFRQDLRKKGWIIVLRDAQTAEIKGFSTMQLLTATVQGTPVCAAFSGDTIIDPDYWGEQELARCWYWLMEKLRETAAPKKLYWFLISKGYRTYLYLPTFFNEFYPRFDKETPLFEQAMIDALAGLKYPNNYRPETGLIEFGESEGNLNAELAAVPAHRAKDPNVRYFLERNPGYAWGNELACLAEFASGNLKPFVQRLIVGTREPAIG